MKKLKNTDEMKEFIKEIDKCQDPYSFYTYVIKKHGIVERSIPPEKVIQMIQNYSAPDGKRLCICLEKERMKNNDEE